MYKLFTPLLLLLSLFSDLPAQAYTFSVHDEPYTELQDGRLLNYDTLLEEPILWDDEEFLVPLGFPFMFFDTSVDALHLWLDVSVLATRSEADIDQGNMASLLQAYSEDLIDRGYYGGSSSLSPLTYHFMGTAPDRIGVFQWKNAGFDDEFVKDGVSDYFTNFQVWLYEDGTIEVRQGPVSSEVVAGAEDTDEATVLLVSEYFIDDATDSVGFGESYYLDGEPENPVFRPILREDLDEEDFTLDGFPAEGTVYRFTATGTSGLFQPTRSVASFQPFPNPTADRFTFDLPEDLAVREGRLSVFDGSGRMVRNLYVPTRDFDLTGLPDGLYHLRLTTETGPPLVGRIVKR